MGLLRPTKSRNQITSFQDEMNELMENFFGGNLFQSPELTSSTLEAMDWTPRVNVSETDKEYKVEVELPGVDEDDIHVDFHDNTLYFKGEKKLEKEEKEENWHRVETSYGSFQRAIPFRAKVDEEKISAKFKKGVLKIKLAKADEATKGRRKISISS